MSPIFRRILIIIAILCGFISAFQNCAPSSHLSTTLPTSASYPTIEIPDSGTNQTGPNDAFPSPTVDSFQPTNAPGVQAALESGTGNGGANQGCVVCGQSTISRYSDGIINNGHVRNIISIAFV